MLYLLQTRNIENFKPVISSAYEDFGPAFSHAIMRWCRLAEDKDDNFWEVWLIKYDEVTVGICGLYSQTKDTKELWLGWFHVIPEYRNKLIGGKILNQLI